MTDLRDDDVVVRARAALWRAIDDALVVLGPHVDRARVITGPAAELWFEVVTPVSLARVVAVLADRHATPRDLVQADVAEVADLLVRDGALERSA